MRHVDMDQARKLNLSIRIALGYNTIVLRNGTPWGTGCAITWFGGYLVQAVTNLMSDTVVTTLFSFSRHWVFVIQDPFYLLRLFYAVTRDSVLHVKTGSVSISQVHGTVFK